MTLSPTREATASFLRRGGRDPILSFQGSGFEPFNSKEASFCAGVRMKICGYLMDSIEGHQGSQLGVKVQVPDDLLEGAKAAEGLEVGQRDGHLGLVVIVRVQVRPLGVQLLGERFVWVRLVGWWQQ